MATSPVTEQTTARAEKLIPLFEQTQADLHASLKGLPEEVCSRKPAPDAWSITEIIEHLTIMEQRIPGMLAARMANAEIALENINALKDGDLFEGVATRSSRVAGPDVVRPTGRFATAKEALDEFDTARVNTIAYVRGEPPYLRGRGVSHPILGPLDGYQWLLALAAHTKRHVSQIEEIKASFTSDPR